MRALSFNPPSLGEKANSQFRTLLRVHNSSDGDTEVADGAPEVFVIQLAFRIPSSSTPFNGRDRMGAKGRTSRADIAQSGIGPDLGIEGFDEGRHYVCLIDRFGVEMTSWLRR